MLGQPVAGGHVEPGVLDLVQLGQPAPAGLALRQLGVNLLVAATLHERAIDLGLDRQPGHAPQLGIGLEQEHVNSGDHLGDVLVRDVGQAVLAELGERGVGAVPEQQELEVVLPHQVKEPQTTTVGVENLVERRVGVVAKGDLVGLVPGQLRHP